MQTTPLPPPPGPSGFQHHRSTRERKRATPRTRYEKSEYTFLPKKYQETEIQVTPASHRLDPSRAIRTFHQYFLYVSDETANKPPGTYADLSSGSSHEPPPGNYTDILKKWVDPQNPDWFGYNAGNKTSRQYIADELNKRMTNAKFDVDGVTLTNGALAALYSIIASTCTPGEEVIALIPTYFHYDPITTANGCKIVKVPTDPKTHYPDANVIRSAITHKTAGLLINTPSNPSGRIYPPRVLKEVGDMLDEVNKGRNKPVVVFADEAYRRIIWDNNKFYSPCDYIKLCVILVHLGQAAPCAGSARYLAIPNSFPSDMHKNYTDTVVKTQMVPWHFPNVVLQYAIPELDQLIIDLPKLQKRRDRLFKLLHDDLGMEVTKPEGTFYLFMKIPSGFGKKRGIPTLSDGTEDDYGFTLKLVEKSVYVLPGHMHDVPGWVRFSVTGTDAMIDYAEPVLKEFLG
ncbi:hypothetical protein HK104_011405 [Borealophlyctis nickersoniae]|nr:hypothetical protein HK104_011405 [Borealophlyctis nickersoniae]